MKTNQKSKNFTRIFELEHQPTWLEIFVVFFLFVFCLFFFCEKKKKERKKKEWRLLPLFLRNFLSGCFSWDDESFCDTDQF